MMTPSREKVASRPSPSALLLLLTWLALSAAPNALVAQHSPSPSERRNAIRAAAAVASAQAMLGFEEAWMYADSVVALDSQHTGEVVEIGPPGWGILMLTDSIESSDTTGRDDDGLSKQQEGVRFELVFAAN